tara:strand:+ start:2730 stop:2930 length:201 start_codon:yes stop_codon:yes gene_type:complete
MAKDKQELTLKEKAQKEMESLVEQHNDLSSSIQEMQNRLGEVRNLLLEKQGYMKALDDCEKDCSNA